MRETYYRGVKEANTAGPGQVWVEEWAAGSGGLPGESMKVRRLDPRFDLFNHSPSGYSWGYGGAGPAQLALALLADATGNDRLARSLHQDFKRRFVSYWGERWRISADSVRSWAASQADALTPEVDEEELMEAREGAPYERR